MRAKLNAPRSRRARNEHHLLARTPVKVQGCSAKVTVDAAQPIEEQTGRECLDRWLAGKNLDPYGNPTGTAYAGGTPLFDETTGRAHTLTRVVGAGGGEGGAANKRPAGGTGRRRPRQQGQQQQQQ